MPGACSRIRTALWLFRLATAAVAGFVAGMITRFVGRSCAGFSIGFSSFGSQ
jgi:hypothetical protein